MCHKFMIHPFLVVGRVRICCLKSKNMLLEEIGYVVEAVCIFCRTTAVVRLHNSWYAHAQQVMCMRWSTVMRQLLFRLMTHPPQGLLAVLRCNLRLLVFGIGEEWWRVVKSRCKLFTPRNADKHRGFRRRGEEWRVKACSLADKKWGASCFHERNRLRPWYYCLWVNEHPKIRTCR